MWHLLSLDAPAVAAVWCWFVARATHRTLSPAIPPAAFLAVWLLYAADRLLDASAGQPLEARHAFHWRHRRAFAVAMGGTALALAWLASAIPPPSLRLYCGLGLLFALWFGLIHFYAKDKPESLPKELAPGLFFAAAVFLSVLPEAPQCVPVLFAAACFAMLCSLNCLYIFAWEHDRNQQAHATTRAAMRYLTPLAILSIAAPLAGIPFSATLTPVLIAIALAAALLLALHRMHRNFDRTNLRAAADLVLLTPLLVAPFLG